MKRTLGTAPRLVAIATAMPYIDEKHEPVCRECRSPAVFTLQYVSADEKVDEHHYCENHLLRELDEHPRMQSELLVFLLKRLLSIER